MMHEFIYNGMNSRDFGLTISGEDTWTRPQPDIKRISVPGRNGDLIQLGNRFQNLDITYHCGIVKDLRTNFDAFNAKLLSDPGFDPKSLLKLYLYGGRYDIRSSRKLEKACVVNIEVVWIWKLWKYADWFQTKQVSRKQKSRALTEQRKR